MSAELKESTEATQPMEDDCDDCSFGVGVGAHTSSLLSGSSFRAAAHSSPSPANSKSTINESITPFPFPFPPYPQQYQLMSRIFETIEKGKGYVAVIESPTGTGKSLSLISSCLYWLLEHHPAQLRAQESANAPITSVGSGRYLPDWVGAQTHAKAAALRKEKEEKDAAMRLLVEKQSKALEARARAIERAEKQSVSGDDEFLLDSTLDARNGRVPTLSAAQELRLQSLLEQQEAESELLHHADTPLAVKMQLILSRVDRAAEIKRLSLGQDASSASSAAVANTTDEIGDLISKMLRPDKPRRKPQIIYASRTHSQLVQMVGEIRKLKYGMSPQQQQQPMKEELPQRQLSNLHSDKIVSAAMPQRVASTLPPQIPTSSPAPTSLSIHQRANTFSPALQAKVISLGSRSNLCIRPQYAHLRKAEHSSRLNDLCLELQKKKNASKDQSDAVAGCEFLNPEALSFFHDHVLSKIHDLEQLTVKGTQLHFCPYYGTRHSSAEADVLVLPYASLLSEATRKSLQVELDDAIIVIDEAHNLHDTINDIYSCRLSFRQLRESRAALKKYSDRFNGRLNATNQANLELLLRVVDAFILALVHSNQQAHAQWKEEKSRGSAFTGYAGGQFASSAKQLEDIFSDGVSDGIVIRETKAKQAKATGGLAASFSASAAAISSKPVSAVSALLEKANKELASASSATSSASRSTYSLMKSLLHFNASLGIHDINYHHVERWMESSEICRKIKGYIDKVSLEEEQEKQAQVVRNNNRPLAKGVRGDGQVVYERSQIDAPYHSTSISPLSPVLEFIKSLNNVDGDGRVVVEVKLDSISGSQIHPDSCLRFLMLNPSVHLTPLLKSARTIILAGGTMQPFDNFKYQLFPSLSTEPTAQSTSSSTSTAQPFKQNSSSSTVSVPLLAIATPIESPRLNFFSFSHVIPSSQIQALIVRSGPSKERPFNFTAAVRGDASRLDDLGATITNLLNVIPEGVVVFFTSYAYANQAIEYWATHAKSDKRVYASEKEAAIAGSKASSSVPPSSNVTAPPSTWLERMRKKKVIFRDAQNTVFEDTLDAYTKIIQQVQAQKSFQVVTASNVPPSPHLSSTASSSASALPASFTDSSVKDGQTGALLFSVVGGKMSEGINFSDGLARSVIMIGLPYPNPKDPEMKEKMEYAEMKARERNPKSGTTRSISSSADSSSISAGESLLHNLCMRAVNQSIGRAIRHVGDYASILLLDERFLRPHVQTLLPSWIKTSDFKPEGVEFAEAFKLVRQFFAEKNPKPADKPLISTFSPQMHAPATATDNDVNRKRKLESLGGATNSKGANESPAETSPRLPPTKLSK